MRALIMAGNSGVGLATAEHLSSAGIEMPLTGRDSYAMDTGSGIFHAVGSCAMGPESDDVADPQLRVRGVDGLPVVDASVLPVQVAGNTQAPTMRSRGSPRI